MTFTREKSLGVFESVTVPASNAISTFNDTNPNAYYDPANPLGSVKVAGLGVKMQVVTELTGPIKVMIVKVTS